MCGIAGYVSEDECPEAAVLERMGRLMRHRGPDDQGLLLDGDVGLVHRRLSIVDLATGHQPVLNEDESVCAMLNGEIYNFAELRADLVKRGHLFRTTGDTEVLVHLYEEHGSAMIERLNGMFAFALFDRGTRTLLIARDRMGQKPLFYHHRPGLFAFGSELDCLRCVPGLDPSVDPDAIGYYLRYRYVPAPLSIYRDIFKLEPGCALELRDGALRSWRYWSIPETPASVVTTPDERERIQEEFAELLRDSVRLRMLADVPVGAFLSGGLDSTVISSLMTEMSPQPIRTFSIGFTVASYDESALAARSARELGTIHDTHRMSEVPIDEVSGILARFGEPFADPSAVPTYYLCRSAARHVKVALSGDGADELLGGYNRYRVGALAERWSRAPHALRSRSLAALIGWLPEGRGYYGSSVVKKLKHSARLLDTLASGGGLASSRAFPPHEFARLFRAREGFDDLDPVAARDRLDRDTSLPERMLRADCRSYLPDDILVKVDRMSMAHSLEVRSPFMDHRVVEAVVRAPMSCKLHEGTSKRMLRRLATDRFPSVARRAKHGFEAPIADWLAGPLHEPLMDMLESVSIDGLDERYLAVLAADHRRGRSDQSGKLWPAFALLSWYDGSAVRPC